MSKLFPVIRGSMITDPFTNMMSDFDSIFDLAFNDRYRSNRNTKSLTTVPRANVVQNDESYSIELAAPGFSRDEFELSVENNTLSISVSTEDTDTYKGKVTSREYTFGSFTRSWSLPENTNSDGISARYEAGILYVDIPIEGSKEYKRTISVD